MARDERGTDAARRCRRCRFHRHGARRVGAPGRRAGSWVSRRRPPRPRRTPWSGSGPSAASPTPSRWWSPRTSTSCTSARPTTSTDRWPTPPSRRASTSCARSPSPSTMPKPPSCAPRLTPRASWRRCRSSTGSTRWCAKRGPHHGRSRPAPPGPRRLPAGLAVHRGRRQLEGGCGVVRSVACLRRHRLALVRPRGVRDRRPAGVGVRRARHRAAAASGARGPRPRLRVGRRGCRPSPRRHHRGRRPRHVPHRSRCRRLARGQPDLVRPQEPAPLRGDRQ